jgi:hypothetical protein
LKYLAVNIGKHLKNMNKKVILLVLVYMLSINFLGAQNIKESLGAINTNFKIYSDTVDLKVSDQIIILRAEKQTYSDATFGTGWGYGYQSFHLEFITKKNIKVENYQFRAGRDNENKLQLIFYDSKNSVLATTSISFDYVDLYNNSSIIDSPFFYSIDLIDIPVVLLDKTAKIGMIKKMAKK